MLLQEHETEANRNATMVHSVENRGMEFYGPQRRSRADGEVCSNPMISQRKKGKKLLTRPASLATAIWASQLYDAASLRRIHEHIGSCPSPNCSPARMPLKSSSADREDSCDRWLEHDG